MKTKLLDLVQFTMRSWLIKEVFRFEGNTVLGEGVANTILKNTRIKTGSKDGNTVLSSGFTNTILKIQAATGDVVGNTVPGGADCS